MDGPVIKNEAREQQIWRTDLTLEQPDMGLNKSLREIIGAGDGPESTMARQRASIISMQCLLAL